MFDILQLDKIWANARYEMMTLRRGWFFRIFAGLAIAILTLVNVIFFSRATNVPRMFYALSASSPYFNMLMLNLAQIVAIALLTSDLFKRDKRINTTDVYYIRPMTNAAYITGKLIGILIVFGLLNLFTLVVAAVIQYAFGDTNFNIIPYLWYGILIPLPAFIFVTGLSFLLIRIVKNQAIVVLLVLGYFAAVIFFLSDQWYFVFDFPAIQLPMIYSDFFGIPNLNAILLQRGLYLILGLIFILLAILFFTRLPQSVTLKRIIKITIILLFFSSLLMGYQYLHIHFEKETLRKHMILLNDVYREKPNISIDKCRIEMEHLGHEIEVNSHLAISNQYSQKLSTVFFTLNPLLIVSSVRMNNQELNFKQNIHLLEIDLTHPIFPGQRDSIRIDYKGKIDDAVCYLDINDEQYKSTYNIWALQIAKKYAILEPEYVLLSPESMWYPKTNIPYQAGELKQNEGMFTEYQLTIKCLEDLTTITQGASTIISSGHISYIPEQPLLGISLIIGQYEKRTIDVDSIAYSLYIHPDHNYFDEYFVNIGDTLSTVLKETQEIYEVKLNLTYPFRRMSLVEVPIPFYTYSRVKTIARELIQPEQIWLPENAAFLRSADFRSINSYMERRLDRSNQTLTNIESETSLLNQFIHSTFLGEFSFFGRMGGPDLVYQPDFNPFPNFYTYSNYVYSKRWPMLNTALEAYLYNRVQNSDSDPRTSMFTDGLTETEEVSQKLTKNSLVELFNSDEENTLLSAIVKAKGSYLFKALQRDLKIPDFDQNLKTAIESNRFKFISDKELLSNMKSESLTGIDSLLEEWYYAKQLPGFIVNDVRLFKVIDNNRMRYQILFKIINAEDVQGLIEVQFQFGRFGRGMMGDPSTTEEPTRLFEIGAGESKEIGIVLDTEPRSLNINFQIAWNIPIIYSKQFEKAELVERYSPFDGERINDHVLDLGISNEIVIDNEDEGFIVYNPPFQSFLKRLIHGDEIIQENTFQRFTSWNPASQWALVKNGSFYGKYIHSAYYIRSGDGEKFVSWQTNLPAEGLYDVYAYMFDKRAFWRRRRGRSGGNSTFGDFTYIIHHDNGDDLVTFDAQNAADGWHFLGTYFFSKGNAKIELTNQSNGRVVVADAVKLVAN